VTAIGRFITLPLFYRIVSDSRKLSEYALHLAR